MVATTWQTKAASLAQKARLWLANMKQRDYTPRDLALIFLVALCFGALIKSNLNDTLTIGFDDYKLSKANTVDLNALQKGLIKNGGTLATSREVPPQGETCQEEQ
ncbi:MAG: hypothetical protein Q8O53_01520 [Candidatus Moranbacteria bacterium]|nr:hypothetical protein [Candidatus Moranbacteria bacterium]